MQRITRDPTGATASALRHTFVLRSGGGPGVAYYSGALQALEDVTGLRMADADLAIGTSAGSVVAARLASGPAAADLLPDAQNLDEVTTALVRRWDNPVGLARNAIGAGLAVTRALSRVPAPRHVVAAVDRVFSAFLYRAQGWESMRLADEWPDQKIWLVTVDSCTNRRVILHRDADMVASLPDAVAASRAVPGVFASSKIGRKLLVDGGVHSPTSLDLAARARSEVLIALAPLSYDPSFLINRLRAAPRTALNIQLVREMRAVWRAGGGPCCCGPRATTSPHVTAPVCSRKPTRTRSGNAATPRRARG